MNDSPRDRTWRLLVTEPADGATNMAIDEALDQVDGPLQRSLADIEAINDDYARQIERIDQRASRARELLIERLSAMESALGLANTMLTQVRAQMDAMNQPS